MTALDASAASDLSAALDRLDEALGSMGSGEPTPYADLWADSDDVTLFGAWSPMEPRSVGGNRDAVASASSTAGDGPTGRPCSRKV